MSEVLLTVEQAADRLKLHPKTVLRHIRAGRLQAARIGRSYRIPESRLDAFAGATAGSAGALAVGPVRATCIVDLPAMSPEAASRLARLLHAAAATGDAATPQLHLQTAFDPEERSMKVILIGAPEDVARLLDMLTIQMRSG
ncbi:helix-turn-helix domain-containing protein [bacterium]|nr:helix-turn-helix domain-containing protein [bacterium]